MMKSAYQQEDIYNLQVIKLAKRWMKHKLITEEQLVNISEAYKSPLFHPNIAIRILLFIVSSVALAGVVGLLMLLAADTGENSMAMLLVISGMGSFIAMEVAFIQRKHFRSGVTDSMTYLGCALMIGGLVWLTEFKSILTIQLIAFLIVTIAAYRYVDLLLTIASIGILAWIIFYQCYDADGLLRQLIPFVFMIFFSGLYFGIIKIKKTDRFILWRDCLLLVEISSLLLIYLGGNYFVVRELTVNMMGLEILPGEDIPFAYVFYFFTVFIPVLYLTIGIRNKSVVLIRTGLIILAFSVFTFKYYFSFGHTEVTLMISGAFASGISIYLLRLLKISRSGFTSQNMFSPIWYNTNVEAFIISQTVGTQQISKNNQGEFGGGDSEGGGASSQF